MKTIYQTKDGRQFEDADAAQQYEESLTPGPYHFFLNGIRYAHDEETISLSMIQQKLTPGQQGQSIFLEVHNAPDKLIGLDDRVSLPAKLFSVPQAWGA